MAKADSRAAGSEAIQEVGGEYVRALPGARRGAGTGMAEEAAPLGDQRMPCGEPGAGELARRIRRAEAGRPPRVSEVWRPASDPSRRHRLAAPRVRACLPHDRK